MNFKIAIICLLFFSPLFSAQLCESLKVRAFGENYAPIGGAEVSVNYQKNDFTSFDAFANAKTDGQGIAQIPLCNQVYPSPSANRSYKITVSAFGSKEERWTAYGRNFFDKMHLEDFIFNVTVHAVNITVLDHTGKLIQHASVELNAPFSSSKNTDALGVASFSLAKGANANFTVTYKGETESIQRAIQANEAINVTLSFYNMSLTAKTFDESASPLSGTIITVNYKGKSKTNVTDEKGIAGFEKINSANATVTASYKGSNKTKEIILIEGAENLLEFNFTKNPLEIQLVNASAEMDDNNCGNIRVVVDASDPRVEKSKLNASITYFFNETILREKEKKLKFNETASLFYTDISCKGKALPLNFSFKVVVNSGWDSREGAVQSLLVVVQTVQPPIETNATNATATNVTPTANETQVIVSEEKAPEPIWKGLEGIQFDLRTVLQALISVIIMAVVLYIIVTLATSLFKRKKKEEPEDFLEKLRKEVEEEMAKKSQQEKRGSFFEAIPKKK